MKSLVKVKKNKLSRLKMAIILYPYLHCWKLIKESLLGRKINKRI